MIDSLMALWNRGTGCRGLVVALTFLLICISISLLLVTASGAGWPLSLRGRVTSNPRSAVDSANLKATHQSTETTVGALPTATTPGNTSNPCLATPQKSKTPATQVVYRNGSGTTNYRYPTPTHQKIRLQPTSTPLKKPTVKPTPKPTTAITPTATPKIPPTPTATPLITPTPTATPLITPTPEITPTMTPSPTPTPVVTPTLTPIASVTPTVTPTAIPSVTITAVDSPTPPLTATARSSKAHFVSMGSVTPDTTPSSASEFDVESQRHGGARRIVCLGNNMGASFSEDVPGVLARFLWEILAASVLGTLLFYAAMYQASLRRIHTYN